MKKLLLTLLSTTGLLHSYAQDAKSLSLQDCIDYGIEHSYTIKNAQLDVLIQKAQNSQTAALALPSVGAKGELNHFPNPQYSFFNQKAFSPQAPDGIIGASFVLPYGNTFTVSASQILFDGGVMVALQARKTILDLKTQQAKLSKENLALTIYKTYFGLVILDKQKELNKKLLSSTRQLLNEIEQQYKTGFTEKIQVDQMAVQVNNLAADSVGMANNIELSEHLLKYVIGMDINIPIKLTDTSISNHINQAIGLLQETSKIENLVSYQLLKDGLDLNKYSLKRYKLAALPSVVAIGAYGNNYGAEKFSDVYKISKYQVFSLVGLQINLPIFNGMKRTYQVQETKYFIEKSKNDIAAFKEATDYVIIQNKTLIKNTYLHLNGNQLNLDLANSVVEQSNKKYKEGVGSTTEIITAQTQLIQAQIAYSQTLLELITAEANLKGALGKIYNN